MTNIKISDSLWTIVKKNPTPGKRCAGFETTFNSNNLNAIRSSRPDSKKSQEKQQPRFGKTSTLINSFLMMHILFIFYPRFCLIFIFEK